MPTPDTVQIMNGTDSDHHFITYCRQLVTKPYATFSTLKCVESFHSDSIVFWVSLLEHSVLIYLFTFIPFLFFVFWYLLLILFLNSIRMYWQCKYFIKSWINLKDSIFLSLNQIHLLLKNYIQERACRILVIRNANNQLYSCYAGK